MAGALIVMTRDFAKVDAGEQRAHVVEGVHGTPSRPTAEGARIVAVQAHQGRQIESGAQAGLPLVEQELETLVGLAAVPSGKLAHGPEPAAVHGGVERRA